MNKVTEIFQSLKDEWIEEAVRQIQEDNTIGIIRNGCVRDIAKRISEATGEIPEGFLTMAENGILREAAYRRFGTRSVPEIIQKYEDLGIFIEVLADCYKDSKVCWRGYIRFNNENFAHKTGWDFKGDDKWISEDCGCRGGDWMDAFNLCVETIEDWLM